ncbi:FecR family protein [Flectobacillus longus]|uniref:FecR family protein n=1 Tax=Flectobacillus longus TaxID=2984207 RepID=UPI0024B78B28|nr:FecR family protein [Flectobacillus longus]MDI9880579.1 FecR family protein [Flectobacillus longus]
MNTKKTFEALLEDASIRHWVYENRNQPTHVWEEWARVQGIEGVYLQQLRIFLSELEGEPLVLDENYIQARVQSALQKAKEIESIKFYDSQIIEESPKTFWRIVSDYWVVAASIMVFVGLGYLVYTAKQNQPLPVVSFDQKLNLSHQEESFVETTNPNKRNKMVVLPDGSTVILQKGSKLKYFDSYNTQNREVYLSGEAFFEVVKNPQKPFLVFTKDIVTKVLGTSFTVKAFDDDKEVKVMVKTGKVNVIQQKNLNIKDITEKTNIGGISLTANQQVTYQREEHKLIKAELNNPQFLSLNNNNQSFTFKSTPISDVFIQLSQAYGIEIVFDEKVMSKCTFTATLGTEPLDEKMKWICAAIDAEYQVSGGRIFVEGRPCR